MNEKENTAFFSMRYEDQMLTEQDALSSFSSLDDTVSGRGYIDTGENMFLDIIRRMEKGIKKGEARRDAVNGADAFETYQREVRELFLSSQGGIPDEWPPLDPVITGTLYYEGYRIEKVIFTSRPGVHVTCNLYLPDSLCAPSAAILLTEGHACDGKAYPAYQQAAQVFVHAGFPVLVMDPVGQSEREQFYDVMTGRSRYADPAEEHHILDNRAKLMGLSLSRYFIHDGIRALEYLASRSEVDPAKIAVTGSSGGGTQTYLLVAAVPERIAAAAPCSINTDMTALVETGNGQNHENVWLGAAAEGLDYADVLSVFAPKPLLLLCNRYDFFPREGAERLNEQLCRFWKQAGGDTVPEIAYSNTDHSYSLSLAKTAARFFSRHLRGYDISLDDFVFRPEEEKTLFCTSAGSVSEEFDDSVSVQEELAAFCDGLQSVRSSLPDGERKKQGIDGIRRLICGNRKDVPANLRVFGDGFCEGLVYRKLGWRAQEGYFGAGILLRHKRFGDGPLPTVIALWENGTHALETHREWILSMCEAGKQVLCADLPCSGTLEPNPIGGKGLRGCFGTLFAYDEFLMQLGDSIAGMRCYQASRLYGVLDELPWDKASGYRYYGEGEYARYAMVAALLRHIPAEISGTCSSYSDLIHDEDPDYGIYGNNIYIDWLIPGILRYADTEDLLKWLSEDGLLINS